MLSPVPHLGGTTDWATTSQRYRDAIVQYLDQLRRAEGDVSAEEAAVDYAAQFKQHPLKKILGGLLSMIVGAPPAVSVPPTVGGEVTPTRSDGPPPAAASNADQNPTTGS